MEHDLEMTVLMEAVRQADEDVIAERLDLTPNTVDGLLNRWYSTLENKEAVA